MPGAIQLMTQRTASYQGVDQAAPVNVACRVIRPALSAHSVPRKEVTLVLTFAKDWSSTSFTICRSGSATGTWTGSSVTGPCPASFNHKPERRTAFSAASIAPEPAWANVLILHRQARPFRPRGSHKRSANLHWSGKKSLQKSLSGEPYQHQP